MRVLVVDDSRVMRQIVIRTLRQAGLGGHEIHEAEDGARALEQVCADPPDLVLCDWNMPVLDGMGLLTAVRRDGHVMPFGFVTSEGSTEMRERAARAGADFVVVKPFDADQVAEALAPWVAP